MNTILFKYSNLIYLYTNLIDKLAAKSHKSCENAIPGLYYFFNYTHSLFNNLQSNPLSNVSLDLLHVVYVGG